MDLFSLQSHLKAVLGVISYAQRGFLVLRACGLPEQANVDAPKVKPMLQRLHTPWIIFTRVGTQSFCTQRLLLRYINAPQRVGHSS